VRKLRTLRPPGPVDATVLARKVAPVAERFGHSAVYLHGRYAEPGPLSDLDLAWSGPTLAADDELELLDALVLVTGREDLDLARLDCASDLLRVRVANGGLLLFGDQRTHVAFITSARRAWFDSAPKRREAARLQALRSRGGEFGRR